MPPSAQQRETSTSPSASGSARPTPKLQPCRACQQRKRKCDRKRPQCSMCEKRGIECVFDLKLSERNPNLLTNLLSALEDKDRRIAALEAIVRDRIPDLANITMIPTSALAPKPLNAANAETQDVKPDSTAANGQPPPSAFSPPPEADPAGQLLSPSLVTHVEEQLLALDIGRENGNSKHRRPSVISAISTQLGVHEPDDDDVGETPSAAAWPPYELALQVVEVFVQTNSMWPIFRRVDLMTDLELVYQQGAASDPDVNATPLQTYNLFLIFSIACVWLAQRGNGNRIDTSLLRNRALSNVRTILRTENSVKCISALALLSLSAIYDWGGPDHVQLTPIIGEMAMAVDLHKQPPAHLPLEEKDRRRLLFWGIYAMDRAVAGNIVRPMYFRNKDILTVDLPTHIDPLGSLGEGFEPLAFFKHLMSMWDLTWEVNMYVRRGMSLEETAKLHGRLEEWYCRTPRPPGKPTLVGNRPDDGDSLFDQYYHMMVATLYRPRTLAQPPAEHIMILQEATSTALRVSAKIQAQGKLFDNYYQFNSIITLGGTLLCSLLLYGGDPANAHDPTWCAAAISEVRAVQTFIGLFCRGWPYARGMSSAFDTLAGRIVDKLSTGLAEATRADATPDREIPHPQLPPGDKAMHEIGLDSALMTAANSLSLDQASLVPGLEVQDLDGTWDAWINDSLVPIHSQGLGDMGEVDMDTLLATIGGSPDWLNAMVSGTQPKHVPHVQHTPYG